MARHRITLVRDDGFAGSGSYSNAEWVAERQRGQVAGFTIESVESLADPPIVKKFEVEITFPATNPPVPLMDYSLAIERSMTLDHAGPIFRRQDRTVTVKEIS